MVAYSTTDHSTDRCVLYSARDACNPAIITHHRGFMLTIDHGGAIISLSTISFVKQQQQQQQSSSYNYLYLSLKVEPSRTSDQKHIVRGY
jgi:hypothetical protein